MTAKEWKSGVERRILENHPKSRDIHINGIIDAQDLYDICKKFKGTYQLHFSQTDVANEEMIQKLIEKDYITHIYIYVTSESILRIILDGAKTTTALLSAQIDGVFSKEEYDMIDHALSQNKSIQDLEVAAPLYKTLKISPAIAKLEISINTMGDMDNSEYIERLFEGLEQNKTVKNFKLLDRSDPENRNILLLNDKSCIAIGKCLSNNCTIEALDITAKVENNVGSEYLVDGFAKNKSIRKLKLSMVINERNTVIFKRAFVENKTITDLDLVHNGVFGLGELITDQSAIKILGTRVYDTKFLNYAISPNCKIEDLFLSLSIYHTGFNPDLNQLLAKNSSIKKFRIESDSKDHIDGFTKGIMQNTSITHLDAYFDDSLPNNIVTLIFSHLKNSKSLLSFKLLCTGAILTDPIVDQFVEVFKTNTTLERLHLKCMKLTNGRRIDELVAALSDNESMTDVDFPGIGNSIKHLSNNEAILSMGYKPSILTNPLFIRNRALRLERIILIHNIARCEQFIALLPIELWRIIFGHFIFPGIKPAFVLKIFDSLP